MKVFHPWFDPPRSYRVSGSRQSQLSLLKHHSPESHRSSNPKHSTPTSVRPQGFGVLGPLYGQREKAPRSNFKPREKAALRAGLTPGGSSSPARGPGIRQERDSAGPAPGGGEWVGLEGARFREVSAGGWGLGRVRGPEGARLCTARAAESGVDRVRGCGPDGDDSAGRAPRGGASAPLVGSAGGGPVRQGPVGKRGPRSWQTRGGRWGRGAGGGKLRARAPSPPPPPPLHPAPPTPAPHMRTAARDVAPGRGGTRAGGDCRWSPAPLGLRREPYCGPAPSPGPGPRRPGPLRGPARRRGRGPGRGPAPPARSLTSAMAVCAREAAAAPGSPDAGPRAHWLKRRGGRGAPGRGRGRGRGGARAGA